MYFFDLQGYDGSDTEGAEFPNDEAARREAVSVARDFARNNLARYGSTHHREKREGRGDPRRAVASGGQTVKLNYDTLLHSSH